MLVFHVFSPPQVIKDVRIRVGDTGDAAGAKEASDLWQETAEGFLRFRKRSHEEEEGTQHKQQPKKIQRKAAYDHLLGLDNMISALRPGGLSAFAPRPGDGNSSIDKLPILQVCEDCGPINYCATWFRLQHLKLREVHLGDPWHLVWNAAWHACVDAGFAGTLHVTTVNHSIAHGPWKNQAFFHQVVEAAIDMAHTVGHDCPLLHKLTPAILMDKGDLGGVQLGTEHEDIHGSLMEAAFVNMNGPQSNKCRWFNWMQAQKWYDCQWHEIQGPPVPGLAAGVHHQGGHQHAPQAPVWEGQAFCQPG